MVAAGYVMTKAAAITCLTVAVGIGGFAWAGFSVNHLDVAPQFASILMGLSNTFATLPGILSPLLTGAVVTDQVRSTGGWDRCVQCLWFYDCVDRRCPHRSGEIHRWMG